jgi:hypothetical protein
MLMKVISQGFGKRKDLALENMKTFSGNIHGVKPWVDASV